MNTTQDIQSNIDKDGQTEDFCMACAAVPFAFAGAGVTAYGSTSSGSNKTLKIIMVVGGLLSIVITLIIAFYSLRNCSDCK